LNSLAEEKMMMMMRPKWKTMLFHFYRNLSARGMIMMTTMKTMKTMKTMIRMKATMTTRTTATMIRMKRTSKKS
jgi:hypothetical protein